MASPKLQIVVGANIAQAEKEFKKLSRRLERLHKEVLSLTVPLLAAGGYAFKAAQNVQDAFRTIRVGTGATGVALKGLMDDFKSLAARSSNSLGDVSSAVADLNTRLGLGGKPLQDMASSVLEASRMTGEGIQPMIAAATRAMNNWQVAVADGTGFMDKLFVASQNTGISMTSLAVSLTKNGEALRLIGMSAEEGIALIAGFERAGVNSEKALKSMKRTVTELGKTGSQDVKEDFRKLISYIASATDETKSMNLAAKYFGRDGAIELFGALRSGKMDVAELAAILMDCEGAIQKNAEESKTFTEKLARMKNMMDVKAAPLGEYLMNLASRVLPLGVDALTNFDGSINKTAVNMGLFAASIGPVSWALSGTASGFAKLLGIMKPVLSPGWLAIKNFANLSSDIHSAKDAVLAAKMAFGGLIPALTGPAGLMTALAAVAAFMVGDFLSANKEASKKTEALKIKIDDLNRSLESMSDSQLKIETTEAEKNVDALTKKIKNMQDASNTINAAIFDSGFQSSIDTVELAKAKEQLTEAQAKLKAIQNRQDYNSLSPEILKVQKDFETSIQQRGSNVKALAAKAVDSINDVLKSFEKGTPIYDYGKSIQASINRQMLQTLGTRGGKFAEPIEAKNTGKSAVQTRIGDINDQVKYLGVDAATFLPEVDALLSKIGPKLTEDRKALLDFKKSTEEGHKDSLFSNLSFQNSMGMLSNGDYAAALQKDFESMKALLADDSVNNWTEEMKDRFRDLQQLMGNVAENSMESLKKRFENNTISSAEYESALAAIIAKYREYPLVVKGAQEALAAVQEEQASKLPTVLSQVNKSFDDMKMKLAELPSSIGDAFTQAIAKGENLGDCLTSLLQDIGAVIVKALFMRSLFGGSEGGGLLGGLFGGSLSASASGNVFDSGGLVPFARGGVVSRPTLFSFADGAGLMGEAGRTPRKRG